MKIILVYAGISNIGFNSYNGNLCMENSWISHGLCSIAAIVKKYGYDIKLVDLRLLRDWYDFRNKIENELPDVVGLSMMSVDFNPVMKCIDIIKDVDKRITVVVGGPHPTLATDEILHTNKIDYIITGEGEISFLNLIRDLEENKKPPRMIKGVTPDLDALPFVHRKLFQYPEAPLPGLAKPFITTIVGRGCKYNCNFCQPAERIIFGKNVRVRSVDNVIAELKELRERVDFRSLMIHDDCLLGETEWIEDFCNKYKEEGFDQHFACQGRSDLIAKNEGLIKHMHGSGLRVLFIGFESGSQRILDFLRKGTTVEQNLEAAKICKKYRIKIWANYMLGIPTETKGEVEETIKMIHKIRPAYNSPSFFTPLPGSGLFEYCKNNNLSIISDHNSYRRDPSEPKIKEVDYVFLNKEIRKLRMKRLLEYFVRPKMAASGKL